MQIGGHRFAQRRDADRGRIAVVAIAQRLDRRLDDEIRRAEIGLADAEIDDVAALRHQQHGPRQHGEGILLADPIEGCDGLQHGVPRARLVSGGSSTKSAVKCKRDGAGHKARAPDKGPGL